MSKWAWYVNRLKAMNLQEVIWRLEQKKIQMKEKRRFSGCKVAVYSFRFNKALEKLRFDCDALGIYFGNRNYSVNTSIHLLNQAFSDRHSQTGSLINTTGICFFL